MTMKTMLVLGLLTALIGCTMLEKVEQHPMTAELITNQLTLRFIAEADDMVARAQKVRDTVASIQEQTEDVEYTLVELEGVVRASIDWQKYSPADQELLNFAISRAGSVIRELIGGGVVSPEERYTIDTLFRWIDQAAARIK